MVFYDNYSILAAFITVSVFWAWSLFQLNRHWREMHFDDEDFPHHQLPIHVHFQDMWHLTVKVWLFTYAIAVWLSWYNPYIAVTLVLAQYKEVANIRPF